MKHSVIFTVVFALLIFLSPEVRSQVKDPVKQTEKEGERRVNRGIDRTIDKGFDKLEEGLKDVFKRKDRKNTGQDENMQTGEDEGSADDPGKGSTASSSGKTAGPLLSWAKYDFVPGDQVIFEDNLLDEENGEFPSRWDLVRGNTEIAAVDGENVIMMRDGAPSIVPYMRDPQKDYLPDVFTIEFDLYYPGDGTFEVYLYDRKNQKSNSPTGYPYIYRFRRTNSYWVRQEADTLMRTLLRKGGCI